MAKEEKKVEQTPEQTPEQREEQLKVMKQLRQQYCNHEFVIGGWETADNTSKVTELICPKCSLIVKIER